MKKKIYLSLFSVIAALCMLSTSAFARDLKIIEVIGDYPRPEVSVQNVVNKISISFLRASEGLKKNQPVVCEVSFDNIPDGTYASIQWTQDGVPLSDGYYSNFGMYNKAAITYNSVLPVYGEAGSSTKVGIDIAIDGVLRRETVTIPFVEGVYLDAQAQGVMAAVQPMKIPATAASATSTYADRNLSTKVGYINAGTNLYYYDRNEEVAAYVQLSDGSYVWIPYSALRVTSSNLTVKDNLSQSEKEMFVNASEYSSTTPYLIWVNLQRQRVNIFMGEQHSWVLQKSFTCATGANSTPTPTGVYKYCGKDTAWIKPDYQVRPVLYFDIYRGLAFHSRLYSPDGSYITDSTMGRPVSHGCIRMMDEDIGWMELYMTFGTTVVVY